jgi:hypothetical protein
MKNGRTKMRWFDGVEHLRNLGMWLTGKQTHKNGMAGESF